MSTNTSSAGDSPGRPDRLAALTAAIDALAAQEPDGLPDAVQAAEVLGLRRLLDRLEGHWLNQLAGVDAHGAAGVEEGQPGGSTAGWLRNRLRLSAGAAASSVRTARALFRGPLTATAEALVDGAISVAHARVLADGIQHLPEHLTREAEPVLVEAAGRLDPPRLRRVLGHLHQVTDPQGADRQAERRHQRRGLWLASTWEGMVAIEGLLEAEAGQSLLAALEPLARPADAADSRSGSQRNADALTELARRSLEAGRLPQAGGVRPQLLVTVDLDSLLGHPGAIGGEVGWAAVLAPEAGRRLACDGALTRVLVTRHPGGHYHPAHDSSDQQQPMARHPGGDHQPAAHHPGGDHQPAAHQPNGEQQPAAHHPNGNQEPVAHHHSGPVGLAGRLRAAITLLPPTLGGAPTQPLEVGRTSRVVQPGQRIALAVRDGGCVFPDCARPLGWCAAHHLRHWLHGGPTDLANLALLCRAHHRAVHEGGWRLARRPDGRLTATPPHRQPHRPHRRHPVAV